MTNMCTLYIIFYFYFAKCLCNYIPSFSGSLNLSLSVFLLRTSPSSSISFIASHFLCPNLHHWIILKRRNEYGFTLILRGAFRIGIGGQLFGPKATTHFIWHCPFKGSPFGDSVQFLSYTLVVPLLIYIRILFFVIYSSLFFPNFFIGIFSAFACISFHSLFVII